MCIFSEHDAYYKKFSIYLRIITYKFLSVGKFSIIYGSLSYGFYLQILLTNII